MRHGLALVRGARGEVERRRTRLERFLAPLDCTWSTVWRGGIARITWHSHAHLRTSTAGSDPDTEVRRSAQKTHDGDRWWWGERLPEALASEEAVLAASDRALRALDGSHAVFALGESGRARVLTGGGGPGGCFAAGDGTVEAWATSASAAALLGTGRLELDRDALPALLAFGALFGERTHVAGVRAVEPGTRIDLGARAAAGTERPLQPEQPATPDGRARAIAVPGGPGSPEVGSYWPRGERWAPLPEAEADAAARAALLETVGTRLPREPAPWLALTAGRDSPVLAAAVRLLGLPVPTFTFGGADWPDVAGARAIAEQLGLEHRHHALGAVPEADAPAEVDRDARWFDGVGSVGPTGSPALPAAMSAMVTGAGAEVGRAYAYQAVARSRPRPRTEHLVAALDPAGRLPGAPPEARASAAAALHAWLEEPGVPQGWRALDALYVEHRVGRWGTARLSRTHPGPIVVPFSAPPLARALSALPLDDRLAVGFHRRLVADVAPDVALPPMQTQRRGIPAPVRRAAAALRRSGAPTGPTPWPWAGIWHERPTLRAWVADDLLADPRLADWLGAPWAAALRTGFATDDAAHAERALLAASLVLWDRAAADASG